VRIDHVIIGARDADDIAELLRLKYGFGMVQGTAHSDGTQGWLVPFDTPEVQYLEILTVRDEATLVGNGFGDLFLERTADGPAFLNWAVLSAGIDADADRVRELTGEDPGLARGASVRPDGRRFPWAEAGFEQSWRCPSRPFFLEYGNWPGRAARVPGDLERAGHRVTPLAFSGLTISSPQPGLAAWWAPYDLPVTVVAGEREAVLAAQVRTADGQVEVTLS
jgi:hypothetical protein